MIEMGISHPECIQVGTKFRFEPEGPENKALTERFTWSKPVPRVTTWLHFVHMRVLTPVHGTRRHRVLSHRTFAKDTQPANVVSGCRSVVA